MTGLIIFLKKIYRYTVIALNGSEKEFTTGSVNKAIFLLSVPMVMEMVLEALFAVVDVFYVSRISVDAVATVGLTESVLMIVYSVAIGLSIGTTAMIARRIGEKKPEEAGKVAAQSMLFALLISLGIALGGFLFAKDILRLMGGSEEVIESGYAFTQIMFSGNITIVMIFLLNGVFRGAGDASIAMRTLWLSNGLNIILDPIFIFGLGPIPEYGVTGAAIATNIGRGIGVIYQLYHLFKPKGGIVKVVASHFKLNLPILKRLIELSMGGMGQFLVESASWVFLVRIIALFGSEALAGYTISIRIIVFSILPTFGIANAAATLVGQNLGAKKPERAEQSVWRASFFTMVVLGMISLIYFILADPLLRIFSEDPVVIAYGVSSLRTICLGYLFFAYGMVISQSLNGAGDTKTPTVINVLCFWFLQIPMAYLLAVKMNQGPLGVFIAIAICFSVHALMCIFVFRQGRWKKVEV